MTATRIEEPLTHTCAPWCGYQDCSKATFREDATCISTQIRIDMASLPAVEDSIYTPEAGWQRGPDCVFVEARRNIDDPAPRIWVRRENDERPVVEFAFTLAEAQQLMEALALLAGQVQR